VKRRVAVIYAHKLQRRDRERNRVSHSAKRSFGDDLEAIAGTGLDKGVGLDALASVHCRAFAMF